MGFAVCLLIELHGYSVLGEKGLTGYLGTVALPWELLGSKKTVANGVQLRVLQSIFVWPTSLEGWEPGLAPS